MALQCKAYVLTLPIARKRHLDQSITCRHRFVSKHRKTNSTPLLGTCKAGIGCELVPWSRV
jgi:hypothetical protein